MNKLRALAVIRRAKRRALEHEFHILLLWIGRLSVGWRLHRAFEDFWAAFEERLTNSNGIYQKLYEFLPQVETKNLLAAITNRSIFSKLASQMILFVPTVITAYLLWQEVTDLDAHNKLLERQIYEQVQQGVEARDLNALQLLTCDVECPSANIRKRALQLLIKDERDKLNRRFDVMKNGFDELKNKVERQFSGTKEIARPSDDILRGAINDLHNYYRIVIDGVNISGISFYFQDINFDNVTFRNSDLRNMKIESYKINSLEILHSNATGTIFSDSYFTNSSFISSDLSNVRFASSCLMSTYFTGSDVNDSSFEKSYVLFPKLSRADGSTYNLGDYTRENPRCRRFEGRAEKDQ